MATWAARPIKDEVVGFLSSTPQKETAEESYGRKWKFAAKIVAALLVGFCLGCALSAWQNQNHKFLSADPHYPLNFLVIGDWGREGTYNQSLVAKQMGRVGRELGSQFVISTGDNFYQRGLEGLHDPKFANSFSKIYTAASLQTQWFAVLGNHDYLGDTLAQLGNGLQRRDGRWFCQRSYQIQRPLCGALITGKCHSFVEFFFIDTTPFVDYYWIPVEKRTFDWRGIGKRDHYIASQLQYLDSALQHSAATWKIVVGHHTIRSLGRHGETPELIKQVLPILEKHNVDLYLNGHDHCLQYIKRNDSNVHFITSGAGSKSFQGLRAGTEQDGLQFGYDGQGFASVSMDTHNLNVDFHDALGHNLHHLNLKKDTFL